MADMREALRKAGLVSDKQVRQTRHQDRVHRKEVGRDGVEQERREQQERAEKEAHEKRERDRLIEQERNAQRVQAPDGSFDPARAIAQGLLPGTIGGNRQYYFQAGGGKISYLELSDNAARMLATGGAALVDNLGGKKPRFVLVTVQTATLLAEHAPHVIREWNRQ